MDGHQHCHVLPELVKASDPDIMGKSPLLKWKEALTNYCGALEVMNMVPAVCLGEAGYEEQLRLDADRLQLHADLCTDALIFLRGDQIISNYFHHVVPRRVIVHGRLLPLGSGAGITRRCCPELSGRRTKHPSLEFAR